MDMIAAQKLRKLGADRGFIGGAGRQVANFAGGPGNLAAGTCR